MTAFKQIPSASSDEAIRAADASDMDLVRTLFCEYANWLRFDFCFQDFERELASLPGAYAPPAGGLWLASVAGQAAGIAALCPLKGVTCELKRVWVRHAFRGGGLGRQLVGRSIQAAVAADYQHLVLETLERLEAAGRLYEQFGFRPADSAGEQLPPGVVRLQLNLVDTGNVAEDDRASP